MVTHSSGYATFAQSKKEAIDRRAR